MGSDLLSVRTGYHAAVHDRTIGDAQWVFDILAADNETGIDHLRKRQHTMGLAHEFMRTVCRFVKARKGRFDACVDRATVVYPFDSWSLTGWLWFNQGPEGQAQEWTLGVSHTNVRVSTIRSLIPDDVLDTAPERIRTQYANVQITRFRSAIHLLSDGEFRPVRIEERRSAYRRVTLLVG